MMIMIVIMKKKNVSGFPLLCADTGHTQERQNKGITSGTSNGAGFHENKFCLESSSRVRNKCLTTMPTMNEKWQSLLLFLASHTILKRWFTAIVVSYFACALVPGLHAALHFSGGTFDVDCK
eukprot:3085065-Amphidinium_carterae.1